MSKLIFALCACLLLAACQQPQYPQIDLVAPAKIKPGFLKVSIDHQYYLDMDSIWADENNKALIHFDMVSNFSIGTQAYKNYPNEYSKSLRGHKAINCESRQYVRTGADIYSEFWGQGIFLTKVKEHQKSLKIKAGSSLDVVASAICANFYKKANIK